MEIDISSINLDDINPGTQELDSLDSIVFEPYPGLAKFTIDGLSSDEYLQKITEEMNQACIDSIPFDKWDYIISFSLALLEVAGDFFIGDPAFKHSLANKNGPFVKWLKQFHKHASNSPLDYQGKGMAWNGSKGDHRAETLGHDSLPIKYLLGRLVSSGKSQEDDSATKTGDVICKNGLLVWDILNAGLAIYSVSSGQFIDFMFTKDGGYKIVIEATTQNGTPYDSCNVFVAFFKWLAHLLADFCSSASLPVPGFSLLTHWPDRDVEAFALKLYRNGMNLRTMALQGIPVAFTEIMMRIYIHCRYKDDNYMEEQLSHKLNKLLLLTHGITTAVNVGKVVITKNPARLNLILITRTCYLVWKVMEGEMRMTNNAVWKLEASVVKNRVESMQTLVLLDRTMYEMNQYDIFIERVRNQTRETLDAERSAQVKFDSSFDEIINKMQ